MADINFNSDRIVYILYKPGAAGEFINRLIHFSKELPPLDPPVSLERMFQFEFTNNGQLLKSANCHGTDNIWINYNNRSSPLPYRSPHFPFSCTSIEETIDYIEQNRLDRFVQYLKEDEKLLLFGVNTIDIPTQLFPNAKTVYISVEDTQGKYFFTRAFYEKMLKTANPTSLNGLDVEDRAHRRALYNDIKFRAARKLGGARRNIDKIRTFDKIPGNKFKLTLSKILSKNRREYNQLCKFLGITPSPHYESYVDAYLAVQWKRPVTS